MTAKLALPIEAEYRGLAAEITAYINKSLPEPKPVFAIGIANRKLDTYDYVEFTYACSPDMRSVIPERLHSAVMNLRPKMLNFRIKHPETSPA